MLLVLFRHSTARRLRQALWQFTPQAAAGAFIWREEDVGKERLRDRGRGRRGRKRGRESRRESRRGRERGEDGEQGGERGRGSDRGTDANRNNGANGRASGDSRVPLHAMHTREHLDAHTVRPTVPDNNSVSQRESKRRGAMGHRAR